MSDSASMPIAPMIDCVFLLLVYFMVSATMDREEAPLPLSLPGSGSAETLNLPEEQLIEIHASGQVWMNELAYDSAESRTLPRLVYALQQFHTIAQRDGMDPVAVLIPQAETPQQRIVDVMDALTRAGIQQIQFAGPAD